MSCGCKFMDAIYATVDDEADSRSHEEVVIDALTDLRLWCHVNEVDFHRALDVSYMHYLAEKDTHEVQR